MNLPDRVAFKIPGLGLEVYWYAILITLGIIAAVVVATICAKKRKMPSDTAIDLCLCAVPLGLVFARLYYVALDFSSFPTFASIINIRNGGLAIPGGIIGGLLGIFIYSRIKKRSVMGYADVIVPGLALAQAIGRWGNFFNQEAYGRAITNPKLLFFPLAVKIEHCDCVGITQQHGHMATFFYESVWCFLIFALLMTLMLKGKMQRKGNIALLYVLLYSFERAIIESFRTDSLMIKGTSIRFTQLLCIVLFVVALVILIKRGISGRHDKEMLNESECFEGADFLKDADDTEDLGSIREEVSNADEKTIILENDQSEEAKTVGNGVAEQEEDQTDDE